MTSLGFEGARRWIGSGKASFAVREIIALIFIVSGVGKLLDLYGFSRIVASYSAVPFAGKILSGWFVVSVSVLIPLAELALGLMLAVKFCVRGTSLTLLVLVFVFTVLSAFHYFTGGASDCGCFGKFFDRRVDIRLFLENALLSAGLLWSYLKARQHERHQSCA